MTTGLSHTYFYGAETNGLIYALNRLGPFASSMFYGKYTLNSSVKAGAM